MKQIEIRNLLGAFLGGALGIIAFAYLKWPGLPFGCLFGVVLGFWHREMWKLLRRSFRIQQRQRKPHPERTTEKTMKRVQLIADIAWHSAFICLIVYIVINGPRTSFNGTMVAHAFVGIGSLMAFFIPTLFSISNREFVRDESVYLELGSIKYAIKLIANYVYFCIGAMIAACCLALGWGAIGLVTAFIPWLFLQSCRIFWRMAMKAGHWPCFFMTTATTGLVALIYHPSPNHQSILWATALLAGIASGIITLALQRLLSRLLQLDETKALLMIKETDDRLNMWNVNWARRKTKLFNAMDRLSEPFPAHL